MRRRTPDDHRRDDPDWTSIEIVTGAHTTKVRDGESSATVVYEKDGRPHTVEADAVLAATGRAPVIGDLALEAAGVRVTERGAVEVDEHLRTSRPHIFALGDVNGGPEFTYVSLDDSRIVLDQLLGGGKRSTDDRVAIPHTVFITPPLSSVGLRKLTRLPTPAGVRPSRGLSVRSRWWRGRDGGHAALRRAGRTAVVVPALVALDVAFIGAPEFALFTAIGGFATLLFVDFTGPPRERLSAQLGLVLAGAVLVCLGTLAAQAVWAAVAATFVIALLALFTGVISSVLAGASTSLLVGFVLPVTLPGTAGSLPDRGGGWLLAGAASLIAIT
ncbi:FAD-dependent oxidoreductase [Stenotrophomonas sp. NPDC087984]